jgi:4'-phosphopantetheinyl transferase
LRLLLACLTREAPQRCRLGYLEFGKPYLASPASDLSFNVAHSGERALFAFGRALDVGVDVEWHRPLRDLDGFAPSVLGPGDHLRWLRLAAQDRLRALYTAWVRKEAVLKAIGKGLTLGLPELEVTFLPGEEAEVRSIQEPFGPAQRWGLVSLAAGRDYSAALAAPIAGLRVL